MESPPLNLSFLIFLIRLLPIVPIRAQYSDAVCGQGFKWMRNDLDQSPCQTVSSILSGCINAPYNLWQLPAANYAYPGPTIQNATAFDYNKCLCSMPVYNLLSACADCQGSSWVSWTRHTENCNAIYTGDNLGGRESLPIAIPSDTMITSWMIVNPLNSTTNGQWNETLSRLLASGVSVSDTHLSTSMSSRSSTGLIVGAVLGSIAVASVIIFFFWTWWNRRKQSLSFQHGRGGGIGIGAGRPGPLNRFRFGRVPSEREALDGDFSGEEGTNKRVTWFGLSGFGSVRKPGGAARSTMLGREKSWVSTFSNSGFERTGGNSGLNGEPEYGYGEWGMRPGKGEQQSGDIKYHVVDAGLPERRIIEDVGGWSHQHDVSKGVASGYRSFYGSSSEGSQTITSQNMKETPDYVDPFEKSKGPPSPNLLSFMPPEPQEPEGHHIQHNVGLTVTRLSNASLTSSPKSLQPVQNDAQSLAISRNYPNTPSISSMSVQYPSLPSSPSPSAHFSPIPSHLSIDQQFASRIPGIPERSRESSAASNFPQQQLQNFGIPMTKSPPISPRREEGQILNIPKFESTAVSSPMFTNVSNQDSLYNQRVSEAFVPGQWGSNTNSNGNFKVNVNIENGTTMPYQVGGYVPSGGAASSAVQFPNGRGGFYSNPM